jgi:hypothetical protein
MHNRKEKIMPDYIEIPLKVFGCGFAISMGIAALIKVLMILIIGKTANIKN